MNPKPSTLPLPDAAFYRRPQVLAMLNVGKSTLHRWVVSDLFPKPVKLGPKASAWRADDVKSWIAQRGQ